MDPRNPHGYTGRTLGSRPSQHGHPPPPPQQQHPPPQYAYGYSSPYGQPAPNYPPQQPYAYPPYGAPAHSAPPPPAPGYGYYPQAPPQQHSYHQPPPSGYGHAPQGGPTHDAPLPPQYAAHAPGPPAAGYVQPANPPHAIYGNHSQTSTVSAFRSTGHKRALLIGINYSGSAKLNGCVRDVTYMTHLLRTKFGFRDSDFYIMTDKPSGIQNVRTGTPTRRGILEAMRWLVSGAQPGDSLFFHFSGHGSQVKDTSGDEADGYDETILPMDYQKAGHIVDDEIYDIMVRRLPQGARLTAVMDCCHSGTGMDLPYIHDASGYGSGMALDAPARPSTTGSLFSIAGSLLSGRPSAAMSQGLQLAGFGRKKKKLQGRPKLPDPNAGEVLLFSGCRDNEVAADTSALAGVVTGAMTYCVIEAIENGSVRDWRSYTYRSLLHAMREKLRAAKLKQIPQFSTSHPFDLSSPFII